MARDPPTRPAPVLHDGSSELPTQLEELDDPAHLRQQIRRLSALVDELVAREAGAAAVAPDRQWALARWRADVERRCRRTEVGALVVAACCVGWTGIVTAILVAVLVSR